MKLTTNQINQIDETLALNKVIYDDIKLELTDHIASDIEGIMSDEEIPFETAFKEAFEKWKDQLKKQKRWFWGPPSQEKLPKIVMTKWVEHFKRLFLYSILMSILTTSLIFGILKAFGNNTIILTILNSVYMLLWIAIPILLIIGNKAITNSKGETTFKYIYKQNFLASIFMFLSPIITTKSFLIFPFFHDFIPNSVVLIFFLLCIHFTLVYPILLFALLFKHILFERKLKTV